VEKRLVLFLVISLGIIVINGWIQAMFFPPQRPAAVKNVAKDGADKDKAAKDKQNPPAEQAVAGTAETSPAAGGNNAQQPEPAAAVEETAVQPQWYTLGSLDPASPYRMLVTITNRGAAVERLELNSPRFKDIEPYPGYTDTGESDRSGYLGYLAEGDDPDVKGCRVNIVGPGTPAAIAGLKVGDVITAFNGKEIASAFELHCALAPTKPGQLVTLGITRDGAAVDVPLSAKLAWRPLAVVQPEKDGQPQDFRRAIGHDPLSLLTTLEQVDSNSVPEGSEELKGVTLRSGTWEILPGDEEGNQTESCVRLRRTIPQYQLEVTKQYRLVEVPPNEQNNQVFPGYHLTLSIKLRNLGSQQRQVAYRLDGPTGLPIEGWWYATKISAGLRDVFVQFDKQALGEIGCATINANENLPHWKDQTLAFLAVDAQYFSAGILPQTPEAREIADAYPMLVGKKQEGKRIKTANTSFRVISKTYDLAPRGELVHDFQVFAGPKRPTLLAQYGDPPYQLDSLISYGWYPWVARPMLWLLHGFYAVVRNYGIAILMLTVLVRMCLFPLSRKQALGAQKMQELQPEIKKINEKHKTDSQARGRATQELFRKHNYNPLGGCLLVFLQLPIFVGLYRSLSVDVELRQAPFLGEGIRWCSNLAAPDMAYNWMSLLPAVLTSPIGFLGPYLNLLPLLAVTLMIVQQKMFMPPATDEQTAMQQSMMKYMMVFVGIMFYWVASGLCLYFIASSIWSIAEKKILPRTLPGGSTLASAAKLNTSANGNSAKQKKKQRRK
jgi:YidC/Oxa1 family membrane protein insertase